MTKNGRNGLILTGLLLVAVVVGVIVVGPAHDGRAEERKAYAREIAPLFDHPNEVWTEGADDRELIMDDRDCSFARAERYAADPKVRALGFQQVRCKGGTDAEVR